jgi:hypothetical protein
MALQDEITLRDEITQIADRIDSIILTINQFYPLEPISAPEKKEEFDQQDR